MSCRSETLDNRHVYCHLKGLGDVTAKGESKRIKLEERHLENVTFYSM